MSRVTLLSGMAYDQETYGSSGVGDPMIRVYGELPGPAQPFGVARVYKGPQGRYEEVVALASPDGEIIWESTPRVIHLRGMMFEDLFRRTVTDPVEITSTDQHELVCYLDGHLVARLPVFIDAPESVQAHGVLLQAAETALKKGSILWVTIPQPDGSQAQRPAWYVQQGTTLYLLSGPGEQELPNITSADEVTLTIKSKDVKATIGSMPASVRVVTDGEEFERVATMGMGTRLNLKDGQAALQRWKDTCQLVELTPRG